MNFIVAGFSIMLAWTTNDLGLDVLGSKIEYLDKSCNNYNLIQIAKVTNNKDQNVIWEMGEKPRNLLQSVNGYYIDHLASKCEQNKKCSPFFNDHWKQGGQIGKYLEKAKIEDYPYGWDKIKAINLEICASCNGTILNCLKYGGEFPMIGNKKIYSIEFNQKPSSDFIEALDKFNIYYKN